MEQKVHSIGSRISTCTKESKKLSHQFVFGILVGIYLVFLGKHSFFIKQCQHVRVFFFFVFDFFQLFLSDLTYNRFDNLYFLP
jgi:predicted membrane channel-forming protein YqfA (hemolysin III family)